MESTAHAREAISALIRFEFVAHFHTLDL